MTTYLDRTITAQHLGISLHRFNEMIAAGEAHGAWRALDLAPTPTYDGQPVAPEKVWYLMFASDEIDRLKKCSAKLLGRN